MIENLNLCEVVEATKAVKDSTFEASLLLLGIYDSLMEKSGDPKLFQGLKNRVIKKMKRGFYVSHE